MPPAPKRVATVSGLLAIVLWSTTIAVARSLAEQLGAIPAAAGVYAVSGGLGLAALAWRRGRRVRQLPRAYLLGCGGLFVAYMVMMYLAIGLAANRQQLLVVSLLNYLWPALTVVASLVLLGVRARWGLLGPGLAMALAGLGLVLVGPAPTGWAGLVAGLGANVPAYALAGSAAAAWALYSTLTRRWAGGGPGGVDLFLPATALVLGGLFLLTDGEPAWTARALGEAGFLGAAIYVAYCLWDFAMRAGNVVLVAAGSYLTPLLSVLVSCLYLAIAPGWDLWAGAVLLVAGSILSWRATRPTEGGQS